MAKESISRPVDESSEATEDRVSTVLHVSMLNRPLSESSGFKAQLTSEVRGSEDLKAEGVSWRTVLIAPKSSRENYEDFPAGVVHPPRWFVGRLGRRFFLWRFVWRMREQFDVILVRHSVLDPFEPLVLSCAENVGIVHHTKSDIELLASGRSFLGRLERVILGQSRRRARWPFGVTGELHEYNRGIGCLAAKPLVLPNGIDMTSVPAPRDLAAPTDSEIHVLFIAAWFVPWHGLDILLGALGRWDSAGQQRVVLHLVGALSDEQKEEVEALHNASVDISVHGVCSLERIHELAARADVGIGSLALHRKGMVEACTLKVREYLAAGVPVYSGHVDSGLPSDFPFYLRTGAVDVDELVSFANSCRAVGKGEVRRAATPYISKGGIMRNAVQRAFPQIVACRDGRQ